jgi:hypothetical protein
MVSSQKIFIITPNVVPDLLILSTLKIESIRSSETSFFTRATRRNIPEDVILHVTVFVIVQRHNFSDSADIGNLFHASASTRSTRAGRRDTQRA